MPIYTACAAWPPRVQPGAGRGAHLEAREGVREGGEAVAHEKELVEAAQGAQLLRHRCQAVAMQGQPGEGGEGGQAGWQLLQPVPRHRQVLQAVQRADGLRQAGQAVACSAQRGITSDAAVGVLVHRRSASQRSHGSAARSTWQVEDDRRASCAHGLQGSG
jgi:hypothetical protein